MRHQPYGVGVERVAGAAGVEPETHGFGVCSKRTTCDNNGQGRTAVSLSNTALLVSTRLLRT